MKLDELFLNDDQILDEALGKLGRKIAAGALTAAGASGIGAGLATVGNTDGPSPQVSSQPAPQAPAEIQKMNLKFPEPAAKITPESPPAPEKPSVQAPKFSFNTQAKLEPRPFLPSTNVRTLLDVAKSMGIKDADDVAGLMGQCKVETRDWQKSTEQFAYSSPEILIRAYTSKFPDKATAQAYINAGEVAVANRALANKNGNGDEASGDGWRYRGRGFIHLTGRENYEAAGKALHPKTPNIYADHPEILSTNPEEAAKVAAWFYLKKVGLGKTSAQASAKINPAGFKQGERAAASKEYRTALALPSHRK